jgi:hypothetical protein
MLLEYCTHTRFPSAISHLSLDELSSEKVFPPQKHHQLKKKEKRKQIEI